jgi:hypothetical protein
MDLDQILPRKDLSTYELPTPVTFCGRDFLRRLAQILPETGRRRHLAAVFQPDRIPVATGAADPAAVTPLLVNLHLLIRRTVGDGSKLAYTHALTASFTLFGIDGGYIFRPKHDGKVVCYRAAHGQAIRPVAIADPPDKGRLKSPDGMT